MDRGSPIEWRPEEEGSVVDQEVEPTEVAKGVADEAAGIRRPRDISPEGLSVHAKGSELPHGGPGGRRGAMIADPYVAPLSRQRQGNGTAQADCPSGDNGHLPREPSG